MFDFDRGDNDWAVRSYQTATVFADLTDAQPLGFDYLHDL